MGPWEEILFDPDEEILVLGGLCENAEQSSLDNLRLGCVILSVEAPYQIDDQG